MINRRSFGQRFAGVVAAVALMVSAASAADKLNVFAAASMKTALDEVSAAWTADTSKDTANAYAASSALAKQIESGAPADVFISADLDWMKYLVDKNLIRPGSEVKLLGNTLVLIAPKDSKAATRIEKGFDIAGLLGDGRLAVCDVKAVPAGKYGKAALEKLGVWGAVENKIAQADNVRAALKFVATGEAPLGIVYRTDANVEPAVKVLDTFPEDSHPPIVYPVAVVAASKNADAAAFVKYLQSQKALDIFKTQGFAILVPGN